MKLEEFPKDKLKDLYCLASLPEVRVIWLTETVVVVRLRVKRPRWDLPNPKHHEEYLEVPLILTPSEAAKLAVILREAAETSGWEAN